MNGCAGSSDRTNRSVRREKQTLRILVTVPIPAIALYMAVRHWNWGSAFTTAAAVL